MFVIPPRACNMRKKSPYFRTSSSLNMAVRGGFEPPIRCRIHTFQACSFSHSDTSPYCHPVVAGTGANVRKSRTSVNPLFQLFSAFSQTSGNMILKCAESAFFINNAASSIICYAGNPIENENKTAQTKQENLWISSFITLHLIPIIG